MKQRNKGWSPFQQQRNNPINPVSMKMTCEASQAKPCPRPAIIALASGVLIIKYQHHGLGLGLPLHDFKPFHLLRKHNQNSSRQTPSPTDRLYQLPVFHQRGLVLDLPRGQPGLDLISQPLQLLNFLLEIFLIFLL